MKTAIDPGHRYVKVCNGSQPPLIIPTVLGEPQSDFMGDNNREEITTSEGHWYIGQTALDQSLTHITGKDDEWAFSPEYRALLLYGIANFVSTSTRSVTVDLILSLPINDYKRNRPALTELIKKDHIIEQPNRRKLSVSIRDLIWLPQGFAPTKPYLGIDKNVVAIDWGSRNINIAQFRGEKIVDRHTLSIEAGAAQVIQDIGKRIEEQHRRELNEPEIVAAIQSGTIRISGQPVDISAILTDRLGYYNRFFESFVSDRWGNGRDIDTFIVFGGGAILAGDSLTEKYPQMVFLEDPQNAQVKAMYAHLKRKLKR